MPKTIKRTYHCEDREEATLREKELEAAGATFETHHNPWDFQPYRIVATIPVKATGACEECGRTDRPLQDGHCRDCWMDKTMADLDGEVAGMSRGPA